MIRKVLFFLLSAFSFVLVSAEEIYINAKTGNDQNIGTELQIKTTGNGSDKAINNDFLKMKNVQLSGVIEIEKDQSKNNYLQLKKGSFGSDLKAGLFKK